MRQTRVMMNMPITVEITNRQAAEADIENIFSYFQSIEERFSVFRPDSEISRINSGEINEVDYSAAMIEVLKKSEQTKRETDGYFDIMIDGRLNPSGLVKGWAIFQAAQILKSSGFKHFYIEAGGDIQSYGLSVSGKPWSVGIRNPFQREQIIKIIHLPPEGLGVATSGNYIRGQHIRNPHQPTAPLTEIVSLTVIGPDIYEADRFATAGFAMGRAGIGFIERLSGFEGYQIDSNGIATMTTEFDKYTQQS